MGQLRTRKRGSLWEWSFEGARIDGKRKTISKGGFRTKAEAMAAGTRAKAEYDRAGSVFTPSTLSVQDYFNYWLKTYVQTECKPNTVRVYSDIVRIHINPYLGKYPLAAVTPAILQEHVNHLYANGLASNYLKNILCVISGAFNYAVHPAGFIRENPAQYVRYPKTLSKKADTNRTVISQEDFQAILDHFQEGDHYRIIFLICYYTGLRIAECTGLTWDKIDLQNGTLTVDRILVKHPEKYWYLGTPKTLSSCRTISIGKTLTAALKKHKKWQLENRLRYREYYKDYYVNPSGKIYGLDHTVDYQTADEKISFICTKEDGTLLNSELCKYASRVVNHKLGIQFNFHSLRHTHATLLIENGADIKDVQERLGHARITTTMDTYVHNTESMKKRSVDIFEKAAGLSTT